MRQGERAHAGILRQKRVGGKVAGLLTCIKACRRPDLKKCRVDEGLGAPTNIAPSRGSRGATKTDSGGCMELMVGDARVVTDDEGYLIDPGDWNESVAEALACSEGLVLNGDHWEVIRFVRAFFDEHQVIPDARFAIRHLADHGMGAKARARLFELFPYGYVKQVCKVAGMRRPRGWSTG